MNNLIHILGSQILHHNLTVLRFFNTVMSQAQPCPVVRQFWIVGSLPAGENLTALNITTFADKGAIAHAVATRAKTEPQTRFFFHGQFNVSIWLLLLTRKLKPAQFWWHIWGADLYEEGQGWRFRLFYLLRRLAYKRVGRVFATQGDVAFFHQRQKHVPASLLYFPTRMATFAASHTYDTEKLTIMVGNSGDSSNRHIAALREIHRQFGNEVSVIIPMGYPANNDTYIGQVRQAAETLFSNDNLHILTEKLAFNDYLALIARCNLGYFMFERQQGIGTLSLLIQANIPVVISRKNPFWRDLSAQQVPVLFAGDLLDKKVIHEAHRQMVSLDKSAIAFFDPAFVAGWKTALRLAEGETA